MAMVRRRAFSKLRQPVIHCVQTTIAVTALLWIGGLAGTVVLVAAGAHAEHRAVEQSYTYASPFHPTQCQAAVEAGCRAFGRDPSNRRAQMILAEGFLCAGLHDDPWALERAISLLSRVVAEDPTNFFARLELADAIRMRYPLSNAAHSALVAVERQLEEADVGAARTEIRRYVRRNLGGIEAARSVMSSSNRQAQSPRTRQPPTIEVLKLLDNALTGPNGAAASESALEAYLHRVTDDPLTSFVSAELRRGRTSRSEVRLLYVEAKARLCADARYQTQCDLATWRLAQLASPAAECAPFNADWAQ